MANFTLSQFANILRIKNTKPISMVMTWRTNFLQALFLFLSRTHPTISSKLLTTNTPPINRGITSASNDLVKPPPDDVFSCSHIFKTVLKINQQLGQQSQF